MGKPSNVVATDEGVPGMPVRKAADQHADHHRQALLGRHRKGEGQGQDHRHRDGEAGDRAGKQPGADTDDHQQQRLDIRDLGECEQQIVIDHRGAPLGPATRCASPLGLGRNLGG
jgi:hypothetical protein